MFSYPRERWLVTYNFKCAGLVIQKQEAEAIAQVEDKEVYKEVGLDEVMQNVLWRKLKKCQ